MSGSGHDKPQNLASHKERRCPWDILSVPPPAEPRGEKKLFFVQILGGEKLLKFVEKCQ